jgi:hypothetical protein
VDVVEMAVVIVSMGTDSAQAVEPALPGHRRGLPGGAAQRRRGDLCL